MNKKFEFRPGFRINALDSMVLAVSSVAILSIVSISQEIAFIIGYAVGHFFLFCNVFRISRKPELVWAGIFVVLGACNILLGIPDWLLLIVSTLVVTIAVISLEMRKKSYHGILWRKVNPELEQWWKQQNVNQG